MIKKINGRAKKQKQPKVKNCKLYLIQQTAVSSAISSSNLSTTSSESSASLTTSSMGCSGALGAGGLAQHAQLEEYETLGKDSFHKEEEEETPQPTEEDSCNLDNCKVAVTLPHIAGLIEPKHLVIRPTPICPHCREMHLFACFTFASSPLRSLCHLCVVFCLYLISLLKLTSHLFSSTSPSYIFFVLKMLSQLVTPLCSPIDVFPTVVHPLFVILPSTSNKGHHLCNFSPQVPKHSL